MLHIELCVIIQYYYILYISVHLYLSFWKVAHLIFLFKTVWEKITKKLKSGMKSSRSLASFKWTSGGSLVAQLGKAPEFSLLWLGSLLWYWFDPWHQNFHTPWMQPKQTQKEGNCISRISPALIA